jgi:hypothetical protein
MTKYKIDKSKLIFDINSLKEQMGSRQYEEVVSLEGLDKEVGLSHLGPQVLLSLRQTLSSLNYKNLIGNQILTEKTIGARDSPSYLYSPTIHWNSINEFRLGFHNEVLKEKITLIEARTGCNVKENIVTDGDGFKFYYYTLETK